MNKIYNYFGLAQRAGQIVSGEQAVKERIRQNKLILLVIAIDAAPNTLIKFKSLAKNRKLKLCVYGQKEKLGHAIGKSPRAVLGVLDRGFANVILTRIKECGCEKD